MGSITSVKVRVMLYISGSGDALHGFA